MKVSKLFNMSGYRQLLTTYLLLITLNLLLEWYYFNFITPSYIKYGFIWHFNILKYIEVKIFLLLLFVGLWYLFRNNRFIFSIYVLLIIFFFYPASIIYCLSDFSGEPMYSIFCMMLPIVLVCNLKLKLVRLNLPEKGKNLFFLCMILLLLVPIIFKMGFYINFENIFLKDVYETRKIFAENCSGILDYFFNWLSKVIIPISIIFFLMNKKYTYAILAVICLLYLYFISGNKLTYITCFSMLFFYFFGKNFQEKILWFLSLLIIVLLFLPILDNLFLSTPILQGTFVMRMLFFPALLNHSYFDFFSNNPLFFAESHFFNLFFPYPYTMKVGFLISQTYFGTVDMFANNGIVSDGYMNLGYFGVAINSIILAIIFLFFNSVNLDSKYFGYFVTLIFLFLSAPMLSMFITSGLFIVMGLSLFLKTKAV